MNRKLSNIRKVQSQQLKKNENVDLSLCLPKDLFNKINGIIEVPFAKEDTFAERDKLVVSEWRSNLDRYSINELSEVTQDRLSCIVKTHQQRKSLIVKFEERVKLEHKLKKLLMNWVSEYTNKLKKEKILWQTKLFQNSKETHEKRLFEQTEELIDIAAICFAIWLKQMDEESNINKEFVKELFSIEIEGDASKALIIEPKELSFVPHEVSKMLNLQELSIQCNVINILEKDSKLKMINLGRNPSKATGDYRSNERCNIKDQMSDIYSLKFVFQSILHLRATGALMKLLETNPDFPRAKYLLKNNVLTNKFPLQIQEQKKPLWNYH